MHMVHKADNDRALTPPWCQALYYHTVLGQHAYFVYTYTIIREYAVHTHVTRGMLTICELGLQSPQGPGELLGAWASNPQHILCMSVCNLAPLMSYACLFPAVGNRRWYLAVATA